MPIYLHAELSLGVQAASLHRDYNFRYSARAGPHNDSSATLTKYLYENPTTPHGLPITAHVATRTRSHYATNR